MVWTSRQLVSQTRSALQHVLIICLSNWLRWKSTYNLVLVQVKVDIIAHYLWKSNSVLCMKKPEAFPPSSSVYGILQARILERIAISFSREYSWPSDSTWVSCTTGGFFTFELPGKPTSILYPLINYLRGNYIQRILSIYFYHFCHSITCNLECECNTFIQYCGEL